MSFERRRWAHLFPLRDDGTPIFENVTVKTATDPEQTVTSSINIDTTNTTNTTTNNNTNVSSPQTNGGGLTSGQQKTHGNDSASNITNSNPYLALNNEREMGFLGFQKASPDSNKFYDHRKNFE